MIRLIQTVPPMVKTLMVWGGVAIGSLMEVFEVQNGVQALDVLLGLQVLVLTAVWQLGREMATKATPHEVRDAVERAFVDFSPRPASGPIVHPDEEDHE